MSDLMARMRAKREAKEAVKPKPVVEAEPTTAKKLAPKLEPTPATPTSLPVKPKVADSFKKKSTSLLGLNVLTTEIKEAVSEADAKVQAQRDAGVYDITPEVKELIGEEADQLVATMQELDHAIIERTPEIRTLSRSIRTNLEQYPELVHLLTDAQLHIMVQGYLTIANVKTAPKTKAAQTATANKRADSLLKSLAGKSVDDLF